MESGAVNFLNASALRGQNHLTAPRSSLTAARGFLTTARSSLAAARSSLTSEQIEKQGENHRKQLVLHLSCRILQSCGLPVEGVGSTESKRSMGQRKGSEAEAEEGVEERRTVKQRVGGRDEMCAKRLGARRVWFVPATFALLF